MFAMEQIILPFQSSVKIYTSYTFFNSYLAKQLFIYLPYWANLYSYVLGQKVNFNC